jgi:hypothetical protein
MEKTMEESLPRNPQDVARVPEPKWPRVPGQPGPQVNRVTVLETGSNRHFESPPRNIHPIDDDQMGGPGSSG